MPAVHALRTKLPSAPTVYARSDPKFTRVAILNSRPRRSWIYAQSEPAPVYFLAFYLASVSDKSFDILSGIPTIFFTYNIRHIIDIVGPARSIWHIFWHSGTSFHIPFGFLSGITSDNSCCHAIWHLFWILSGICGCCIFSHSLWHSISPRRLRSRSGGQHSDPGFAVEVRPGDVERSGSHRI